MSTASRQTAHSALCDAIRFTLRADQCRDPQTKAFWQGAAWARAIDTCAACVDADINATGWAVQRFLVASSCAKPVFKAA